MKKECKIVQDLLPNYLEKVTNEETNKFIEEHIANCEECNKTYLAMKQELKVNSIDTKKEIKYMKKFKTKLKILRNILMIVIVIFLIIVGRKAIILAKVFNTSTEVYDKDNYEQIQIGERAWIQNDLNNYYSKNISIYSNGRVILIERYCKDGKTLVTFENSDIYEKGVYTKETYYSDGKENLSFKENSKGDKEIITNTNMQGGLLRQVPSLGDGFLDEYFKYLLFADIYETNLEGKECYVIRIENSEQFVDKETGMTIKSVNNEYNIVSDYYYEFGTVTDEDVKKPEISTQNN